MIRETYIEGIFITMEEHNENAARYRAENGYPEYIEGEEDNPAPQVRELSSSDEIQFKDNWKPSTDDPKIEYMAPPDESIDDQDSVDDVNENLVDDVDESVDDSADDVNDKVDDEFGDEDPEDDEVDDELDDESAEDGDGDDE